MPMGRRVSQVAGWSQNGVYQVAGAHTHYEASDPDTIDSDSVNGVGRGFSTT